MAIDRKGCERRARDGRLPLHCYFADDDVSRVSDEPDFDFILAGVRSLSVDLHKFGYSSKGASLVLYRCEADQRFQFYVFL